MIQRLLFLHIKQKAGDIIKIREGSKNKKIFEGMVLKLKDYVFPNWISFDVNKIEGKILDKPQKYRKFYRFKCSA